MSDAKYSRLRPTVLALMLGLLPAAGLALEDPTRPPVPRVSEPAAGPQAAPRHRLESIIIGPDRRVAVINGRALREGQQAQGLQVERIRPGQVRVRINNEKKTLRLATPPAVRQP